MEEREKDKNCETIEVRLVYIYNERRCGIICYMCMCVCVCVMYLVL